MTICEPQAGETVVVDAASGAVGSVVGQLAKSVGCRVVGIAGGSLKCQYVVNELGFDACVDHKDPAFERLLDQALPNGIDCLFENVGGAVFEALLPRMNVFSRIALCGMVSEFNRPAHAHHTIRSILINRIKVQGFIVSDRMDTWPEIRQALRQRVVSGELKFRESIAHGLQNAPAALVGMLKGENFGKQLVKLTP
jgi:NADPH-dependent curcumin reductase CurA